MKQLVRLDLERIRRNLEASTGAEQTHEDVLRLLATRGVWRRDEEWWTADQSKLGRFAEGEVLETKPAG